MVYWYFPRPLAEVIEGNRGLPPSVACVYNEKMDMIGSHDVINDTKTKKIFCLVKPITPTPFVFVKFQQQFLFMATVGDVPDAAWNIMSICSRPRTDFLKRTFLGAVTK